MKPDAAYSIQFTSPLVPRLGIMTGTQSSQVFGMFKVYGINSVPNFGLLLGPFNKACLRDSPCGLRVEEDPDVEKKSNMKPQPQS